MDVAIHTDTNALKGIIVRRALILVLNIKKRQPAEIKKDHLVTRTGLALTTRSMVFGPLLNSSEKLSSIALNVILLSALK